MLMKVSGKKSGDARCAKDSLSYAGRAFSWLILSCLLPGAPPEAVAQDDGDVEYRVKLAFLYNFAQFVHWPPEAFHSPISPLTVCVAGQNPFQGEIGEGLRGRTVGGHPVEIKTLRPNDDPKACHMIFVRGSEKKLAQKLVGALKGSNTLTVGENGGFADLGGMINLTLDQNKVRFEINLDAATQTSLRISSKLLALAKIVNVGRSP